MVCSKCNSENVIVQSVSQKVKKKKGWMYWVLFGWFVDLMLWIFLTLPRLVWAIFKPKDTVTYSQAVCQNCGNTWRV